MASWTSRFAGVASGLAPPPLAKRAEYPQSRHDVRRVRGHRSGQRIVPGRPACSETSKRIAAIALLPALPAAGAFSGAPVWRSARPAVRAVRPRAPEMSLTNFLTSFRSLPCPHALQRTLRNRPWPSRRYSNWTATAVRAPSPAGVFRAMPARDASAAAGLPARHRIVSK